MIWFLIPPFRFQNWLKNTPKKVFRLALKFFSLCATKLFARAQVNEYCNCISGFFLFFLSFEKTGGD